MVQAQRLQGDPLKQADLSVDEAEYFGKPLSAIDNLGGYPFDPDNGPLKRHSYVFQALYRIGSGQNAEYGGIQLRARVAAYGALPPKLKTRLRWIAHRAAFMYDSTIESVTYDGYLTGFNVFNLYSNFEKEPVTTDEVLNIGVIDWSTEVYTDDEFNSADLSGIAQGLAYPYRVETLTEEGSAPVDVPAHEWGIETYDSRPEYYELRPPAGTASRDRYRDGAGNGKKVYVNGKYVATMDDKGRAWLKTEYARGDGWKHGEKWSRRGLVESDDDATWQAIRDGGTLYLTGETSEGVYLATARAKPEGWKSFDPDDVPVDLEVREGAPGRVVNLLRLVDQGATIPVECRRDEELDKHLGYSSPDYTHHLSERQTWQPTDHGGPQ